VSLSTIHLSIPRMHVSLQFYWLNVQVGYDGDIYLTIVLNGLIHTLMYTYYFVSMHTKEIWWKPALTMGQMIQFCLMNLQAVYLIFVPGVQFPRNITVAYLFYILTLLFLFAQFFVRSYMSPKKKGGDKEKKAK
jgi:elongation of very long chain fatty acids protein 4